MAGRYRGVTKRGQGWQLSFSLPNGTRCRESVRFPQTRKGEDEAFAMRAQILAEIDRGTFDYAQWFPRSKNAKRFSSNPGQHILIRDALREYLVRERDRIAQSTYYNYETRIYKHLIPAFGQLSLAQLTAEDVRIWCQMQDLSGKSLNNILIPLRSILTDAYQAGMIDRNPLDRIKAYPVQRREPHPFTVIEVRRILKALNRRSKEIRLYFQLAFATGLRTSELLALSWDDIDLENLRLFFSKAWVRGQMKSPKTAAGRRTVDLNILAIKALKALFAYRSKGRVFLNPITGEPWQSEQMLRKSYWYPALDAAGVMRRNPYQTRHTFASHMLSCGENPMYVAMQMSHSDWGMIRQVYGRYIK